MKKLCSRVVVMAFCVVGLSATLLGVPATAAGSDSVAEPPSQLVVNALELEAATHSGSAHVSLGLLGLFEVRRVWEW